MVDSGHRRRTPLVSPVLRPALWSSLLAATVAAVLAAPAYAEPGLPNTVPDSGSRPVVVGQLQLPGGTTGTPPPVTPGIPADLGPLAAEIATLETQVALQGQDLLQLRQKHNEALAQLAVADEDLRIARDDLAKAQAAADSAAAEALKIAAALPPGEFGSDLHGLSVLDRLNRGTGTEADSSAPAREATRARGVEQHAYEAYLAAQARTQTAATEYSTAEKSYREQEAKLLKLRKDNAERLAEIERAQEAAEQSLGAGYTDGTDIGGMAAHPRARAAVRYALNQLGDPYLWAAEGPDRFDCSGLMWAAYRSKGADYFSLPRVAKDQYYATRGKSVSRYALLPGDMIFFASGSSWTTIHHVGMYIGNGKMVHAPSSGDVVKISTVRWSRFYAATRVFGAVPAPTTTPTPKPTPTTPKPTPTTPKPTPTPTTPKPTPSTSTPPPTTTPPTTTPPTIPPPTTTPPTDPPEETTEPSVDPSSGDPGSSRSASASAAG